MFYFILSGLSIAFSFLLPETLASVLFGWAFCLFYILGLKKTEKLARGALLCGLVSHIIAFYWLPFTLEYFGGFPKVLAYLIFLLFCLYSSLQFIFANLLYRKLLKYRFLGPSLALALSWGFFEFVMPRLFPWAVAHSQLAFLPFASLVEFFSVTGLSVLMFYFTGSLISLFAISRGSSSTSSEHSIQAIGFLKKFQPILSCILFLVLILVGYLRNLEVAELISKAPKIKLALIQGNIEAMQKNDPASLRENLLKYRSITEEAIKAGAEVVVWPEAVFMAWTPEGKFRVEGTRYDPAPGLRVPLIYGGLSYRPKKDSAEQYHSYNTAFARSAEGEILGYYHKKILMPFGEYMPFSKWLPFLKKLSPQTGDFSAGESSEPLNIQVEDVLLKAGILICYEDLIPSLSRETRRNGANILVNLTNDAWYGDSAALLQHHLIASWRAIENRRTLVRVTNTGFTAAVSPLGQTIDSIETAKEGYLLLNAPLISQ